MMYDEKSPVWMREGWQPGPPGYCRCPTCKKLVTTNALGRAAHIRAHVKREERQA